MVFDAGASLQLSYCQTEVEEEALKAASAGGGCSWETQNQKEKGETEEKHRGH